MARRVKPGEAISAKSWNEIVDNVNGIGGVASQPVAGATRTLKARWYNGSSMSIRSGSVVSISGFRHQTDPLTQRSSFLREGFVFTGPAYSGAVTPMAMATLLSNAKRHALVPCYIEGVVAGFVKRNDDSNHKRARIQDIDANGVNFIEANDGPYEIVCVSSIGKLWEGDEEYRFVCMRREGAGVSSGHVVRTMQETITGNQKTTFRIDGEDVEVGCPLLGDEASIQEGKVVIVSRNLSGDWQIIEAQC